MKILEKFKRFKKLDFRWKLKILSKYIRFEIYPSKYPENFFEKFKYKLIFNLILKNKSKSFKKYYFNNLKSQYDSQFVLTTLPRSGTIWITNILHSYFELIYNFGDGNLKYNPLTDDFKSNTPEKIFDLFNGINLYKENSNPNLLKKFKFKYIENVGHYPLSDINMQNAELINFIVLFRNPVDACYSRFLMDNSMQNELTNSINFNKLKDNKQLHLRINQVKKYFNFWNRIYLKEKKNKLLFILYEDLQKNIEQEILKILRFAKIKIDNIIVKKAIKLNSKDEIQKKISINKDTIRITNKNIGDNENKVREFISGELKKGNNIYLNYKF